MPYVEITKPRPHVSVVTLNRPERLNALSFETVQPLHDAILEVGADNDTWVVILTGAGRGFCSGLDLEDHGVPPNIAGLPMSRIATRAMAIFSDLVPAMRGIPQPIVGAINGPSYGGGLCLAVACDIRLAAASATFCGAGIKNGLTGTELGISWILPRAIGAAHAFELILTGREVDAREAERIGLVSRVVADDALLDTAVALATRIAANPPLAVRRLKAGLREALDPDWDVLGAWVSRSLAELFRTEDHREGVKAFLEKRPPRYVGR
jgi:enoyl-CoA hydratase